jgi:hypothetical protein
VILAVLMPERLAAIDITVPIVFEVDTGPPDASRRSTGAPGIAAGPFDCAVSVTATSSIAPAIDCSGPRSGGCWTERPLHVDSPSLSGS